MRMFRIQDPQGESPQYSLLALQDHLELDDGELDDIADLDVGEQVSFDGKITVFREE